MKKSLLFLATILSISLLSSCGESTTGTGDATDSTATTTTEGIPTEKQAICLWPKVGVREMADPNAAGNNSLATAVFGERVEMLGQTEKVGDKTYIKIKLSDGTEGWVNEYLFAQKAKLAAITKMTSIYERPDQMTLIRDKKAEFGEIVAVMNKEGDWIQVLGKKKSIKGYILGDDHYVTNEKDLRAAIARDHALDLSGQEKKDYLDLIVRNTDFTGSIFQMDAEAMLDELNKPVELAEDELMITGDKVNIRSEPDSEMENAIAQLNNGDICKVIATGDMVTIGDKTDYWYQINHPDVEGWVFGAFTSRAQQPQ